MTEAEIKKEISKRNETVQYGYLWVYLDKTIKQVNINQYLEYLGYVAGEDGYIFVYDPYYKIVRKYGIATNNPKYLIDDEPLEIEKDTPTPETPTQTPKPKKSTNFSFDFSKWIPYFVGLSVIIVIVVVYQKNNNNQFY